MRSPQACLSRSACEDPLPTEINSNCTRTWTRWWTRRKHIMIDLHQTKEKNGVVSRNHTRGTWGVRERSGASSANTRRSTELWKSNLPRSHLYRYRKRRDTQDNNRGNDLECRKILLEGRGDQQTDSRGTGGISLTALQLPRQKVDTSSCGIRSWKLVDISLVTKRLRIQCEFLTNHRDWGFGKKNECSLLQLSSNIYNFYISTWIRFRIYKCRAYKV